MVTLTTGSYARQLFDYWNSFDGGIERVEQIGSGLRISFGGGREKDIGFPDARELYYYIQSVTGSGGSIIYLRNSPYHYNGGYYYGMDCATGVSCVTSNSAVCTKAYVDSGSLLRAYNSLVTTPIEKKIEKKDDSKKSSTIRKLFWSYYQRHGVKPF